MITAADDTMIELFSGLTGRQFAKLTGSCAARAPNHHSRATRGVVVREQSASGRGLLTQQPDFASDRGAVRTSKSAADRIVDDPAPKLALRPRQRFTPETVLIADGTLVPTRDHTVAAKSKNYRYSTNHQVVIHADTRLVVAIGEPLPGDRNDCNAYSESGIEDTVRNAAVIADSGYRGTSAIIPHRHTSKHRPLAAWKEVHNASHRAVRAHIEHTFAAKERWNILHDCRLRGPGAAEAMAGIARLYNLTITG